MSLVNKTKKNIIAVIPARGGSKRFKNKNLSKLCSQPLLSYPIKAAQKAKLVDRVIVSTDSRKIADLALKCGAEVPFMRPQDLATDLSAVVKTIKYTARRLVKEGYPVQYILLLQTTTPLVTSRQIDTALKLALSKSADSVITVSEVNNINNPYNIRQINKQSGKISFWKDKEHYKYAGKKRPKFYHACNMWITSYETLVKTDKLEGKNNYPIVLDEIYSMDIDYKNDLEMIEVYLQYKKRI